ncbi:MAG: ATP-dependent DNA ligase [Candidatus Lokiarchaeota archaeon]
MLCKKADTKIIFNNNYIFQPKLDGTRVIYIDGNLINRRGRNIKQRYPEFKEFQIKNNSILDGEVVVYNERGLPDFSLLQSREQTSNKFKIEFLSNKHPATYVVFDCLKFEGKEIINEPLEYRLECLKKAITEGNQLQLIFSTENGLKLWNKAKELGIEGIMAKRKGSKYYPGKRVIACLKIKNVNTIDCIILGYTMGEGKRKETFGALLIGIYNKKGDLISLGKVGTGWTDQGLIDLKKLVCEVEYLEMTENKELRAPSFKSLRFDKEPRDCIYEFN